jgi:hypothetical protein
VLLSYRSELADIVRLPFRAFAVFRLARVEAEALVWHCGREGVAVARAREKQSVGAPRVQWLHDWLVRVLAERSFRLLRGVGVGTRYDVAAAWARRPGQMIIR